MEDGECVVIAEL